MHRPEHEQYARHLIGRALPPWGKDMPESHPCFDNDRDFGADGVVLKDAVASRGGGLVNQDGCDIKCAYTGGHARVSQRKTNPNVP